MIFTFFPFPGTVIFTAVLSPSAGMHTFLGLFTPFAQILPFYCIYNFIFIFSPFLSFSIAVKEGEFTYLTPFSLPIF
jgi:hypothetical protein